MILTYILRYFTHPNADSSTITLILQALIRYNIRLRLWRDNLTLQRPLLDESDAATPAALDSMHYHASSTGDVAITAHFLRSQKQDKGHGQNSLYKDLLHDAWSQGKLSAYNNRDGFFRNVGTVDSWLMSQDDPLIQGNLRYNK